MIIQKKLFLIIFSLIIIAGSLSGCTNSGTAKKVADEPCAFVTKTEYQSLRQFDGMDVVSQNDEMMLLFKPDTANVGVYVKASGKLWMSGVQNSTENQSENDSVRSDLILYYYTSNSNEQQMTSYTDCIAKNQYQVFSVPDGIRIEYTIGESESSDTFPRALSAEYVEKTILPKLDEQSSAYFLQFFEKYEYDKTDVDYRKDLSKEFKNFSDVDMYMMRADEDIPVKFLKVLKIALKSAGLDSKKLQEEYNKIGFAYQIEYAPSFIIPVEYTLEQDHLVTNVRYSEVEYMEDHFYLTSVEVLPYFGACPSAEDGYMFVPDGSGALINLNNKNVNAISVSVFGKDLNQEYENISELICENGHLPVFGLKNGANAVFTVLENGAALADIIAVPYQNESGLNHVYARYDVLMRQTFKPEGLVQGKEFVQYGSEIYSGDIKESRYFLDNEKSNYSAMAALYRKLLFGTRELNPSENVLFLETYGIIDSKEMVLGCKVNKKEAMTTVAQLSSMLKELNESNVSNISVRYRNWYSDPMVDAVNDKTGVNSKLGSSDSLRKLISGYEGKGVQIYPEFEIMYTTKENRGIGISLRRDISTSIRNVYLKKYFFGDDENSAYYLNTLGINKLLDIAKKTAQKNSWKNICLGDVGTDLYGDYNKKSFQSRNAAQLGISRSVKSVADSCSVMIDGANSYLLNAADVAMNIPLESSNYSTQNETVPFLPMVLHGYVDYTGSSVNLASNMQTQFLKCVEYGASLSFTLNYQSSIVLRDSMYKDLNSSEFNTHKEKVSEMYAEYENKLKPVFGSIMQSHKKISESVYATGYSNGYTSYVNYRSEDFVLENGEKVPGMDFIVFDAKEGKSS